MCFCITKICFDMCFYIGRDLFEDVFCIAKICFDMCFYIGRYVFEYVFFYIAEMCSKMCLCFICVLYSRDVFENMLLYSRDVFLEVFYICRDMFGDMF